MNRRICYVGTEITPSTGSTFVGGHVNTIVGLCKGLSNLGWEIHIVTTPSRFLKDEEFIFPWAKIHLVNASGTYGSLKYNFDFLLKAVRRIENLNKSKSFDLIHAHSGYFSLAIIPVVIKKRLGLPAFFSLYCPASLLPTKLPLDKYGIKSLSLSLDKVIAVTSNVNKSLIRSDVRADKIEVIPSCIDKLFFEYFPLDTNIQKKLETNSKTPMVLFVGNLDKAKGLDVFLNAAKSLLHINPMIRFVITLHEPNDTLEKFSVIASHKLGSSVVVKGVVKDMAGLMSRADVVVVPFRSTEGISDIPLVVLEAMALGKSVVASKLEGIEEVICNGENGILVEPDRVHDLANAIIALIEDSNIRVKIGEHAISSVKRFSYDEISLTLNDLYLKVLENS